ncbi:MAG TPA: potassium channel family protein [Pirellulales bacterium]|nr:potassium channel family protein [Pirellulales bacterium]
MIVSLVIAAGMYALTLCTLMAPTILFIRIVTGKGQNDLTRPSYPMNILLLQVAAAVLLFSHLVNIALWAVLFYLCGEFTEFETAYYYSAVTYSSLGYGDLVMSPRWRLLGPLETIDGIVMFGISTALVFALLDRMIARRLKHLNLGS